MKLGEIGTQAALRYAAVRAATEALAAPLSDEDCCAQSMTDASPVKWHLAHTTWFFETFVLEGFEPRFRAFSPAFRMLFNSYYDAVGARHPRPERGLLTRPSLATVRDYRADVDARVSRLLAAAPTPDALTLIELGLNHEQQHQELILTDVKHLLSRNPIWPAYRETAADCSGRRLAAGSPVEWVELEGGVVEIGSEGAGFAFDNESPRHRQFLEPYALADRLATNGEFAAFIDDGGYRRPELWLSNGWDFVQSERLLQPVYWQRAGDRLAEFTLSGLLPLDPDAPVVHLSYFEADAFARWSGARLPTEFEWEHAVVSQGPADARTRGNFADDGALHPRPAGPAEPGALRQAFGDAWEWTSSSYSPYPGFAPAEGAVGEYNGKFMVDQYVLRGGSCATPRGHVRATYRNFFPTAARWQFSAVRLARSLR